MDGLMRDERPALKITKKGEMKKSVTIFNNVLKEIGFDSVSIHSAKHWHSEFGGYGEYASYKACGTDKYGDSFTLSFNPDNETKNTASSIDELIGEKGYIESVSCSRDGEKCKSLRKEGMLISAKGPSEKPVSSAAAVISANGDMEITVYSQRPGFYKSEIEKLKSALDEKLRVYGAGVEMV